MLDLVIRDAQVFDGLGSAPVHADVGVQDGVVTQINVEAPGEFKVSSAEHMLGNL